MAVSPGERYVALGSSFAAGPGLRPRAPGSPRPAGRSTKNYAHVLAGLLQLDLHDETFSGATTADLLTSARAGRPAQLDAVTPGTRLVTITAGGNDIGYLPTLTLGSLPGPLRLLPAVRRTVASSRSSQAMDDRFEVLRAGLGRSVERVRQTAPEARILLVDYLTILPPDASVMAPPLPPALAAWGREQAARLSAELQDIAGSTGCTFVAAGEASRAHHAWSAEPWTRRFHYSLRGGAPYHPTVRGMAAVAELLAEQIRAL